MQSRFLEKRVEILERTVEGLNGLPARVEALEGQVSQLRTEMRGEFSGVREEIRKGDEETRTFMRVLHEAAIARIAVVAEGHEETRQQLRSVQEQVSGLRGEVTALREDLTGFRQDVIQRFTALGKQLTRPGRKKKP